MDRYSKRERLGLVAIAIAALASVATGAMPTPTPDLLATKKGTITVTAEAPVAWLDVSARENEALIAAGGRTEVHIRGQPQDSGVLLLAGPPGGYITSGLAAVSGQVACPVGQPCDSMVRLTAILLDPVAHPTVDVSWTAAAESRFPANTSPVPAAALAVEAGGVNSAPATKLGLATTDPETIELGPDLPRAVRNVRLTLPVGPAADAIPNPGAFLRTWDMAGDPGNRSPVTTRVLQDGEVIGNRADWSTSLISPFRGCEAGVPCDAELRIEFNWNGGTADGSTIEWSLASWAGVSTLESTPPAAIAFLDPADVVWDRPPLTTSVSGQTHVTRSGGASVRMSATVDDSEVPPGERKITGLVRLTFRAALAPGVDPSAEIGVTMGEALDVARIRPGHPVVVYSRAVEVACDSKEPCRASFDIVLFRDGNELPEATVDWTADVAFLPLTPAGAPDGLKLPVTVRTR